MAYAHSPNDRGEWHELVDHLRCVAKLTAEFAEPLGAREAGYYLGLWHDIGKFDPEWQRYLRECAARQRKRGTGPDHKAAGARLAADHLGGVALAVQGHHGGLPAHRDLGDLVEKGSARAGAVAALRLGREAAEDAGLPLDPDGAVDLPPHAEDEPHSAELFIRLLYSALVDADSLDTEAHESAERAASRGSDVTIAELWERFERYHATLPEPSAENVRDARVEIYHACLQAAEHPPGLFRLAAPTGGGKTLSAMAFALRHALRNGQRRVIVAVPFITITEQTADAYRRAFGAGDDERPIVLEHHSGNRDREWRANRPHAEERHRDDSAAADDDPEEGDFRPGATWSQLAAENWDAPIVVTTTVQLFESLFARRRSACRKLHRLANAIVILDEAQALPPHLLDPILDALRELAANYGTTVLLSTATQPAFEALAGFADLDAHKILPESGRLFRSLERVRYDWRLDTPLSWDEAAGLLRAEPTALAILNTKNDALALLFALGDDDAFHLSTLLCGAHRRAVLAEICCRLRSGQPCRLVATQVVEAGVDLDFPFVLRALGPLDAIIQAAGRCNREGRLNRGLTVVFQPVEGGSPAGAYKVGRALTAAALAAASHAGRDFDPNDPAAYAAYSRELFAHISTDREGIQALRAALDYPKVADKFRMIDEETVSVIVAYGTPDQQAEVRDATEALRAWRGNPRQLRRAVQPFTVPVPANRLDRVLDKEYLCEVTDGLWEWLGKYDERFGLVGAGLNAESHVI